MRKIIYNLLLFLLRMLVYIKRALVWAVKSLGKILLFLGNFFNKYIGFWFFKLGIGIKRRFGKWHVPWDSRWVEFVGKRSTLQIVLFLVCVTIMIPHSRLYSKESGQISGRDSVLFSLVGPGYQDFSLEEISVDVSLSRPKATTGWREGAVSTISPGSVGVETEREVGDIAGISAGGSALTKPTILPGSDLPVEETEEVETQRREVLVYEVQPGDVIGNIATKFGISINTILWANNLSYNSYIRPGDQLKILPTSGVVHKVKSGDTVSKIARLYGADQEKIVDVNRLQRDGADIVIGEELLVPGGEKPTVTRSTYTPPKQTVFNQVAAPPPSISTPAGTAYLWPTSARRISQYYGWRHTGLDIAAPVGTPIYATKAGKVIKSQCGWNGGYGCYTIIDHGGGVQTVYAHASKLYVSVGEWVTQGQTIQAMGSTGRSTGPHIHFEVRVNGRRLNPLQYIR